MPPAVSTTKVPLALARFIAVVVVVVVRVAEVATILVVVKATASEALTSCDGRGLGEGSDQSLDLGIFEVQ